MKKFNQVITVEVSVDSIAEQLLKTMNPEFAHAEMLTETIIGTSLDKGTIGFLYNSLNGYTNDIDFQIGQEVTCTESIYSYQQVSNGVEDIRYEEKRQPMGNATVIDINPYTHNKLHVEYYIINREGKTVKVNRWVDHKTCSGINNMV